MMKTPQSDETLWDVIKIHHFNESKDKDNNWLGLSASLLAGEIAFRGYFSKDTTPLGPTRQQQTQVLLLYIGAAAPPLEKCKSSDPNVITILL